MVLTPSEKNGSPQGVSSLGTFSAEAMDHRDEGASAKSSQAPAAPAQRSRTAVAAGAIARRQLAGPVRRPPLCFAPFGRTPPSPNRRSKRNRYARIRADGSGSM